MVVAKCISKNRNNRGVIVNYTLQDQSGQQRVVTGQQIKEAIQAGKIDIVNLQIDKAGRLVDKAEDKRRIDRKHNVYSIPHTVEEANAWLESMGANDLRIGKQEYKNNARYGVYTIKNNRVLIISTVLESLCLCIDYISTNNELYRMFSDCVKLPHKNWVDNEGYEEDGYNCVDDWLYFNEELKIFVEGTPEGMYGVLKKHKTTESCLYSDRADNSVHVETFARYGRAGGYAYVVCDSNGNKKRLSSIKKGYTTSNEDGVETNIYVPVEVGDYYIEYCGGIVRIHKIISLDGNYINTEMTEYNPETKLLDLEILKKQFGKLAPAIEFAYKKAYDSELKMGDYVIDALDSATENMLNEAKRVFDSEIYYAGGTGAFQFTVRVFEEYCKENNKTLEDLLAVIPEEFQKGLHTALIYYIYENNDGHGDCKKAVENISKHEGEIIGKLAVYLLKKYGNHLGEFECSSITETWDNGYINIKYGVYKRKPKGKDIEQVNWENILGGLKQSRFSYGDIDIFIGNVEGTQYIKSASDIKEVFDGQRDRLTGKTLARYDYHVAEGKENINVFIKPYSTNSHETCKENMFKLIKDYKKHFDYYGITAELYCRGSEGFLKLYCE